MTFAQNCLHLVSFLLRLMKLFWVPFLYLFCVRFNFISTRDCVFVSQNIVGNLRRWVETILKRRYKGDVFRHFISNHDIFIPQTSFLLSFSKARLFWIKDILRHTNSSALEKAFEVQKVSSLTFGIMCWYHGLMVKIHSKVKSIRESFEVFFNFCSILNFQFVFPLTTIESREEWALNDASKTWVQSLPWLANSFQVSYTSVSFTSPVNFHRQAESEERKINSSACRIVHFGKCMVFIYIPTLLLHLRLWFEAFLGKCMSHWFVAFQWLQCLN